VMDQPPQLSGRLRLASSTDTLSAPVAVDAPHRTRPRGIVGRFRVEWST
jgi:hypothetical protein